MPLPNGGCAGSASITTSRSRRTSTACITRLARREVEVRLTPRTVEVFLKGERIAAHLRSSGNHRHTTVSDHMPRLQRLPCECARSCSGHIAGDIYRDDLQAGFQNVYHI